MKKFKLFIENFLVYGFGGIISKIVPIIMIPIVTRLMPTTDYFGISDLSNTVVSFASAIAIMGMYDAMYRLFFEKEDKEYKKDVCSTAFIFTIISSIIIFLILIILKKQIAYYFFNDSKYSYVVYISAMATLVGATNAIISAPTRMQNKRRVFLITNTISPILSYAISVPMLIAGYYTIALPLAAVVSGFAMEVSFWILNKKWFQLKRFNKKILKDLLVIAIPLLPNFLIYWVFNSCDKVMITNMIDLGAAGIYSVGSKLGNCSHLIYTAFAGGWQYFAFSTMNEEKQVENNTKIFEYLGLISFIVTAFVCALSYWIFKLLFTEQYLSGYIVAPYLFLAPLLQMLFQVAANQFLVSKKTWPNMLILLTGAVVNIFINYLLIPLMGIEGASIATVLGYAVSDIVCMIVLTRMKLMSLSKKFIVATLIIFIYIIIWRNYFSSKILLGMLMAVVVTMIYLYMYREELIIFKKFLKEKNR